MFNGERMHNNRSEFGLMNLDGSYKQAEKELDQYRIPENDFVGVYGQKKIDADIEIANQLRNKFSKRNSPEEEKAKKFATIFESILNIQAELGNWLGSDTIITPTSLYDDYINHVDMIVEIEQEESASSHIGLAIDATFSNNLEKKFIEIKEKIAVGKMAEIKYFQSNNGDFKGQLSNIPRAVITADVETITELLELQTAKNKDALNNHWIQFQVLEQLMIQMKFFQEYAEKCQQEALAKKLKITHIIISKIYKERVAAINDFGKRDGANDNILQHLKMFF
ncbi:MAG: hypothetical protein WC823_05170 [Parcubacteria group bacterium]|jgi:hypothetical protein